MENSCILSFPLVNDDVLLISCEKENDGPKTAFHGTFENMRSAEDNMMDFIDQEKSEIAAQLQQLSSP